MKRRSTVLFILVELVFLILSAASAQAAGAPQEIKIGTLYASVGPFAVASQNEFKGLNFWAKKNNQGGGECVKAYGKKIPVKIVSYDDRSADYIARDLYKKLIETDHIDILVSDFGSVLTEPAIEVAKTHQMLLIDPTGSSANFFSAPTNYLANVSIPSSQFWPLPLSQFILNNKKIKKVAILFAANPFDSSQEKTLSSELMSHGIYPYFLALDNGSNDFGKIIDQLKSAQPDAVIELGYAPNDIAFLKALSQSGQHFPMTFTIFPGQLLDLVTRKAGAKALTYTYTYPMPPLVKYDSVNYGMNTEEFVQAFKSAENKQPDFLSVAGYNTGLIVQHMLDTAPQFNQLAFHQAIMDISGKTTTLLGPFGVNANGAQVGQSMPVAQFIPDGDANKLVVVYPEDKAQGNAVYPAP
jgi:branched-chain amino acid transport system substrate-binding protein